jgi:uncharacterized caspase-like protein
LILSVSSQAQAEKWALLVGVNEYMNSHFTSLRGCENDVAMVEDLLATRYNFDRTHMRVLLSRQATKQAIVNGIRWLIQNVEPGDVAVFHFSGHGSQAPDQNGDEADRVDESICPADVAFEHWNNDITDDELGSLLAQIRTDNLLVILDSCHSGTGTRRYDVIPRRITFLERGFNGITSGGTQVAEGARGMLDKGLGNHILIAGCLDHQTSADASFRAPDGQVFYAGVLTYYLTQELRRIDNKVTFCSVGEDVRRSVASASFNQTPQVEGQCDRPVFLGMESPIAAVQITGISGDRATLNVGRLHGATVGSIYDIFGDGAPQRRRAVGKVQVVSVADRTSQALVLPGSDVLQPEFFAVEVVHNYGTDQLFIGFDGESRFGRHIDVLREGLERLDYVTVTEPGAFADWMLRGEVTEGGLTAWLFGDGVEGRRVSAPSDSVLLVGLAPLLENAYAVKRLASLDNPAPPFRVDVRVNGGKVARVQQGEPIEVSFWSEADCYLYLIDVGTSGQITVLFPNRYTINNAVRAGRSYIIPSEQMEFRLRAEGPPGYDLIKAVATRDRIDLETLNTGAFTGTFRSLSDGVRTSRGILEGLFVGLRSKGLRDVRAESTSLPNAEWATDSAFLKIE